MKFTKMQGCGNDYVYINCFTETVEDAASLAKKVSDRHFGIGSDGLILIKPSKTEDFAMDMYNADGSQSEMCGNGIRCVGKYVYEHGMTKKTKITIETLAGTKNLQLCVEHDKVTEVSIDMGSPNLNPAEIPVDINEKLVVHKPVMIGETEYIITCVSVGNPHVIVFVPDVQNFPVSEIGPLFENHPMFPQRINTEFVELVNRKTVRMRVWERGSGETHACGTGATACAYAAIINGYTEDEVEVRMTGGTLNIYYDSTENRLFMTGPAVTVFEGEME